jgi:hypothetical protein
MVMGGELVWFTGEDVAALEADMCKGVEVEGNGTGLGRRAVAAVPGRDDPQPRQVVFRLREEREGG